jgi:hypothetical protein
MPSTGSSLATSTGQTAILLFLLPGQPALRGFLKPRDANGSFMTDDIPTTADDDRHGHLMRGAQLDLFVILCQCKQAKAGPCVAALPACLRSRLVV